MNLQAELIETLQEQHSRHNRECFLVPFGWKDADLDPWGCTGIKSIEVDEKDMVIHVEVGGHKTLCCPTYEFDYELDEEDERNYSEVANEIACGTGCDGHWSGDDWSFSFDDAFALRLVVGESLDGLVQRVDEAAQEARQDYCAEMELASTMMDSLYNELYAKYEKREDERIQAEKAPKRLSLLLALQGRTKSLQQATKQQSDSLELALFE